MIKWLKKVFKKPRKYSCVVLGMEASGKTSLLYLLSSGRYMLDIQYTNMDKGHNASHVRDPEQPDQSLMTVYEISGRADYHLRCHGWERFLWNKHAIVFTVECCSTEKDMIIASKIIHWLGTRMALMDMPLIVLGTKCDVRGSRSQRDLWRDLDLAGLSRKRENIICHTMSAEDRVGISDVVRTLFDSCEMCRKDRKERKKMEQNSPKHKQKQLPTSASMEDLPKKEAKKKPKPEPSTMRRTKSEARPDVSTMIREVEDVVHDSDFSSPEMEREPVPQKAWRPRDRAGFGTPVATKAPATPTLSLRNEGLRSRRARFLREQQGSSQSPIIQASGSPA